MSKSSMEKLEREIEVVRAELNEAVKKTGIDSYFTIKISEKLDRLLIRHSRNQLKASKTA